MIQGIHQEDCFRNAHYSDGVPKGLVIVSDTGQGMRLSNRKGKFITEMKGVADVSKTKEPIVTQKELLAFVLEMAKRKGIEL